MLNKLTPFTIFTKTLLENEPTSYKAVREQLIQLMGTMDPRSHTEAVVDYVGVDEARFEVLLDLFAGNDPHLTHFSTWSFTAIARERPEWIRPHLQRLFNKLNDSNSTIALQRAIGRFFQWAEIQESFEGSLYNLCLEHIVNPKSPIAIKAYSMAICERIANHYPELIHEVYVAIDSQLQFSSAGLRNRGSKILSRWQRAGHLAHAAE